MTCEQFQQCVVDYALGVMDEEDARAMAEHLAAECDQCRLALAAAEAVTSQLACALEPETPPPSIEQQIFEQILAPATIPMPTPASADTPAATEESEAAQQSATKTVRGKWRGLWAASILCAIGGFSYWVGARSHGPSYDDQLAMERSDVPRAAAADRLQQRIREEQAQKPLPEVAGLRRIHLKGTEPTGAGWGYVTADLASRQWHLLVFDLLPPPANRKYQVWLAHGTGESTEWRPAGELRVDAAGSGKVILPMPEDDSQVHSLAITDERVIGAEKPTGKVRLIARLRKP